MTELSQGATVAGKYRLENRLGIGGMGEVWSATQTVTRKAVALKFLRDLSADATELRRRFLREARAACAVRHPNVVEVHDVLELEDGSPVMVMELLEGETLEARLKREGRMGLGDLASVLVRVVSAVGTAHALGIVHRDLKPDNIFLSTTADGLDVKVLDFGIAKLTALEGDAAQTGGLTSTGAMLGTPYYMSPEQAFGEKNIDHRADIWSLGIILYRGITGILPTRADNMGQILKIIMTRSIPPIGEVAPQLPADVVSLVSRMLESDPLKRPDDLVEVKTLLERYAGTTVDAFPSPSSAPLEIADTLSDPNAASSTPALARSGAVGSLPPKASKLAPVLLSVVAVAALGGAVALLAGGKSAPSAAGGSNTAALPTAESATAAMIAPTSPPPSAPPSSAPVASAVASAATPAPPIATHGTRRPTSSSVPATPPAPDPVATAKPSLGGVIEKPAF